MILMILFIVLFVVGLIILLINHYGDLDCEVLFWLGAFPLIFGGIVSMACGIAIIVENSSITCTEVRIKYEEQVKELNHTYSFLTTYDDPSYAKYTAIQQYNAEVSEFKSDILTKQKFLNNKWTSWFVCKEYKNVDVHAVKYIEVK